MSDVPHAPPFWGFASVAVERQVAVITRRGLVGTVTGYVPLDTSLVDAVRTRSGLAPADRLVLLSQATVIAASAQLSGVLTLAPGRTAPVRVSGVRYRALVAPAVSQGVYLAVLSPQSLIDAANATSRNRLLL